VRAWLGALALAVSLASSTSVAAADDAPLPAGDYFRPFYSTCPCCPRPMAAVLAGVYAVEPEAATAVARAAALRLPLGYPLVLHTAELGLAGAVPSGIAVVLGLFPDEASARSWRDKLGPGFSAAMVVNLLDEQTFSKSLQGKVDPDTPAATVVRIASGSAVPAFSAGEIEKLRAKDHSSTLGSSKLKPSHPVCTVPPGAFFVAHEKESRSFVYRWAPVRCGNELAYVAWDKTMVKATVVPVGGGAYHLVQVVDMASEDEPVYGEWLFDQDGRHPLPRGLPRSQRIALRLKGGDASACQRH
jgi:hypothetical protein